MLWGQAFSFWETVVRVSLILAVATGVLAAAFGFIAGYVGYELSDAAQKEADSRIKEAHDIGDVARADAAKANSEAALANQRAAQLSKEAEEARLETERLKARIAWRSLSPSQIEIIKAAIASFSDQKYVVRSSMSDAESQNYGNQFEALFRSIGREVNGTLDMFSQPVIGVHLALNPAARARNEGPPGTQALLDALYAAGITGNNRANLSADVPDGWIGIIVGSRS